MRCGVSLSLCRFQKNQIRNSFTLARSSQRLPTYDCVYSQSINFIFGSTALFQELFYLLFIVRIFTSYLKSLSFGVEKQFTSFSS